MLRLRRSGKAQIALEFLIVYSFVLIIFILLFSIISSQRSATLGQQQYSLLQLQSQNVASYIDQAAQAGTGYSASVPLVSGVSHNNYNLSISSTGVVIASTQIATQPIVAYSFSHARSFVINGTLERSANGINIYQISTSKGSLSISNLKGTIYINQVPASITSLVQGAIVSQQANVKAAVFNDSQDSYIVVPNSNALTFGGSFTMSFWFYISAERQECGSILGKATAAQIAIDVAAPCTAGYYSNDILDFNYGSHSYASPSVPSDTWTHGVVVVDVTNAIMTWYLNGVKVAAYNGVASIPQDAQTLYIGNGDATFNGSVANLQIYNSILNGNQISSLYLSGMGGPPVNSTLAGWWPLNGNPNDYSGYGDSGDTDKQSQIHQCHTIGCTRLFCLRKQHCEYDSWLYIQQRLHQQQWIVLLCIYKQQRGSKRLRNSGEFRRLRERECRYFQWQCNNYRQPDSMVAVGFRLRDECAGSESLS